MGGGLLRHQHSLGSNCLSIGVDFVGFVMAVLLMTSWLPDSMRAVELER